MRVAIITDIHANLPALESVLEDIGGHEPEEIWCLGDVLGYGAQPDECARLVAERCAIRLVGNHDLAVLGELDISSFSPAASAAVRWTQANADPATLDGMRDLKPADTSREVSLYHASPRDPIWEYVLWPDQAAACLETQATAVSLVGHSHVALFFVSPPDHEAGNEDARGAQAAAGTRLDLADGRWLINPGSVGQPRDGDPRAAWLELDTGSWEATYHRIKYDIDAAAAAIDATDLPGHLARRLYVGQ